VETDYFYPFPVKPEMGKAALYCSVILARRKLVWVPVFRNKPVSTDGRSNGR
jgi:hypothetical protein